MQEQASGYVVGACRNGKSSSRPRCGQLCSHLREPPVQPGLVESNLASCGPLDFLKGVGAKDRRYARRILVSAVLVLCGMAVLGECLVLCLVTASMLIAVPAIMLVLWHGPWLLSLVLA